MFRGKLYGAWIEKNAKIRYAISRRMMGMNDKKIGALIYQLRIEKKLTQKQLAAALHVSDKAISKWERGSGCQMCIRDSVSKGNLFHV